LVYIIFLANFAKYVFRWNSFYNSINLFENNEKMDEVCAKLQVPFFTKPQDIDFLNEYCKVIVID